jgi:hypothetical protein
LAGISAPLVMATLTGYALKVVVLVSPRGDCLQAAGLDRGSTRESCDLSQDGGRSQTHCKPTWTLPIILLNAEEQICKSIVD